MRYFISMIMLLLSGNVVAEDQAKCLASVIYHESRGEPLKGQVAVAHVVLNRTVDEDFPDTICKVIFQKNQFSGLRKIKYDHDAMIVARNVLMNKYINPIGDSVYFRFHGLKPKKKRVIRIGNHVFY